MKWRAKNGSRPSKAACTVSPNQDPPTYILSRPTFSVRARLSLELPLRVANHQATDAPP
jgi:hypothetical protein